jgi:TRAP-type C4-dicarboxylate transport system permease small subunit
MRNFLDRIYRAALWVAALCLVGIALLVGTQLAGRIIDGTLKLLGREPYGIVVLSLAEFSGFLLAAASFFALAATLKAGTHIRVTMLLTSLSERARRFAEIWVLGFTAVTAIYLTWYLGRFAYLSWLFHEVSPGVIPAPLWIPQAAMTLGAAVLALALIDEFLIVLKGARPTFRAHEDSFILGKES